MAAKLPAAGVQGSWTLAGMTVVTVAVLALLLAPSQGAPAALLASILLALALVGGVAGAQRLGALEATVEVPAQVRAGEPFPVVVRLRSAPGALTTRDLVVEVVLPGEPPRVIGVAARLAGGAAFSARRDLRVYGRGRRRSVAVRARSSFPFGFRRRERVLHAEIDLLVLPEAVRLTAFPVDPAAAPAGKRRPEAGVEQLRGLHDWRPGESRRRIHWRLSARRGAPVVRELEDPGRTGLHVVFDTRVPAARAPRRAFERAVRVAAGVLEHSRRSGRQVRFSWIDGTGRVTMLRPNVTGTTAPLRLLAEIEPATGCALQPVLPRTGRGEALVLIAVGGAAGERLGIPPLRALDPATEETRRWLCRRCGVPSSDWTPGGGRWP